MRRHTHIARLVLPLTAQLAYVDVFRHLSQYIIFTGYFHDILRIGSKYACLGDSVASRKIPIVVFTYIQKKNCVNWIN